MRWFVLFSCLVFGIQSAASETNMEKTIHGGTVVVLGKRIPPPYKIEVRSNALFINDILVDPLIERGDQVIPLVIDDIRKKHEFLSGLKEDYLNFYEHFGPERFQETLLKKYEKNSFVKQMLFQGKDLKVTFHDGEKEFLIMGHVRHLIDQGIKKEEWEKRVKEANQDHRIKSAEISAGSLERGWMLIYDHGSMSMLPPEIADKVITVLSGLKSGTWSLEQVQKELKSAGIADNVFKQIQENIDSW